MPKERQTPVDHTDHCASVPHPFMSVLVFWCPHLQRWAGWVDVGRSTHDVDCISSRELTWGPFDTDADVSSTVSHFLSAETLASICRL